MELSGKVFAVTGGGNGIGREVVLELLRRDASVAALDLRSDSLAETAAIASAGDRLVTIAVDVTDRAAVAALPEQVVDALGTVDGLINVAGIIQPFVPLADLEFTDIERVIDVNLYGTLNTVKAFLPVLMTRPSAYVVNTSSMGAFLPVPGQTIYGASKAAVKLMTEGLYAELLETPIQVSVVMPGAVGTEISSNSGVAVPGGAAAAEESSMPVTAADEAARIILDGMQDGDLHIFVGRDSRTMNIAMRVSPRRAIGLIQRRMKSILG